MPPGSPPQRPTPPLRTEAAPQSWLLVRISTLCLSLSSPATPHFVSCIFLHSHQIREQSGRSCEFGKLPSAFSLGPCRNKRISFLSPSAKTTASNVIHPLPAPSVVPVLHERNRLKSLLNFQWERYSWRYSWPSPTFCMCLG